jgi:LmbE family N-acetylglucosaminyl deacetylase
LKRYADAGHAVTVIYLTRGERGIPGKENAEAAKIRSAECEAACKIIGAKPVFAGQIDGSSEFNGTRLEEMKKLVANEKPDLVFAQWPIDTHIDHQVASLLTTRAWMALPHETRLYFYEVNGGSQTQGFFPNTYVDISAVVEKKKAALFAHASQDGEAIWRQHHEVMASWRGREAGVAMAEAFVHLSRYVQVATLPGT